MYNNPNWKWVISDHDTALETDKWFLARYKLRNITSFHLHRLVNLNSNWRLSTHSSSKIQKWIVSRLSLQDTSYVSVHFKDGELEAFLDDLDQMAEILYGKN